jgi:hypothetical protein
LHAESFVFHSESKYGSIIFKLESGTKIYFEEDSKTLNAISLLGKQ